MVLRIFFCDISHSFTEKTTLEHICDFFNLSERDFRVWALVVITNFNQLSLGNLVNNLTIFFNLNNDKNKKYINIIFDNSIP